MQDAEGQGFGETAPMPNTLFSRLRERRGEGPLPRRRKRRRVMPEQAAAYAPRACGS